LVKGGTLAIGRGWVLAWRVGIRGVGWGYVWTAGWGWGWGRCRVGETSGRVVGGVVGIRLNGGLGLGLG
jgi:hypothetical protein